MSAEERFKLITRNAQEVITNKELMEKLETGGKLKGYIGYEPSGLVHIGWLIWMFKVKDLVDAGVDFTVLEATWHAHINDKLGGDLDLIRKSTKIVRAVFEAIGVSEDKLHYIDAEDLASDKDYWALLIKVAKNNTLHRVKRAMTIMGRKAEEAEIDASKVLYPMMQVSDIFYLDLDIALGGMDQRKAHMLARDTAEKLGMKKPIAIHTPILTGLKGVGRMDVAGKDKDEILAEVKMSKSKPEYTIFVHYPPEKIREVIRRAYCPARQTEYNPVIEINKYLLFQQDGFKLVVERPAKYGGTVVYDSFEDLERDFREGKLHPADLKNATANALIDFLAPIRERLLSDKETLDTIITIEKYYGLNITSSQ